MSNIDTSCFSEIDQKFLLSVTVHEATNLAVLNADTFIVVGFEGTFKRTTVSENCDNPYFNEYFVFDIVCSLRDLLKKSLTVRVIQQKWICQKNVAIGEVTLDLSAIWEAPSNDKRFMVETF